MEKRETTLAKNTIIFAIGNFGSKVLQLILIPYYTRVMTSGEYGTVDLLQAVVSLLLPVMAMSIFESVFRYAMEDDYDKTGVFSVGVVVTVLGTAVACILGLFVMRWTEPSYVWMVIVNTAMVAFWTLMSQYTKAIGRSMLFAVNNIFLTAAVLLLNILFLTVLHWGIPGYMLGYTLANFLAGMMLVICLGKQCRIDLRRVRRPLVKEMLIFSIPLMLNGICWWLSNFTDRVMISAMLGTAENGIYAAASKIPHLVSVVVMVFCQAWQISANEEFARGDIENFYSSIFDKISAFVFLLSSVLILCSRPLNSVFLGADYSTAWRLMPPLTLAAAFYSFAAFLCSVYSANKETKMALVTNLACVVSNVVLNYVLLRKMGTIGAAVATAISYLLLWGIRILDTRKIIRMHYQAGKVLAATVIVVAQAVLICLDGDITITYGLSALGLVAIVVMYWRTLLGLAQFAWSFARHTLLHR